MEPVYTQNYEIKDNMVDCFGNLRPGQILFIAQDMGTRHCQELSLSYDVLESHRLFWAVTRHRVQITRLPKSGETIRVETWAMPTTRVAYPRSVVAYDEKGQELFRSITLWVLMNMDTRARAALRSWARTGAWSLPPPRALSPGIWSIPVPEGCASRTWTGTAT